MTSLATIVFKSGVAVEVPFGAVEAAQLLESFDENWDEDGPQIVLPANARSSGCRLLPSEIVGIFVSHVEEEDEDEDDTPDAEEDSAEGLDDDEEEFDDEKINEAA